MLFHKQRLEERTVIAVEGSMRFAGQACPVTLVNASSSGVLAMLETPPPRGTMIQLTVGGVELAGQVRWRGTDRCGIALREQIDVNRLLGGRMVPITFIPVDHLDSYRGPNGILRTIFSEGPIAVRTGNAALLLLAVASTAFALSRLGVRVADGATISVHAIVGLLT